MRAADAERDSSFVAVDVSAVPRSFSISAPGRVGEFVSALRAEKYQNFTAVGIASNDLASEWDLPRSVAVALPLMPAVQALPSASPKADDAFQGSSGRDVPAQVELIHSALHGNIRFLRIPAGWGRREADIVDRVLGRLNWADTGPKGMPRGGTGLRALAVIRLRARNRKTRGASRCFA
jgi:hypothetical protein